MTFLIKSACNSSPTVASATMLSDIQHYKTMTVRMTLLWALLCWLLFKSITRSFVMKSFIPSVIIKTIMLSIISFVTILLSDVAPQLPADSVGIYQQGKLVARMVRKTKRSYSRRIKNWPHETRRLLDTWPPKWCRKVSWLFRRRQCNLTPSTKPAPNVMQLFKGVTYSSVLRANVWFWQTSPSRKPLLKARAQYSWPPFTN